MRSAGAALATGMIAALMCGCGLQSPADVMATVTHDDVVATAPSTDPAPTTAQPLPEVPASQQATFRVRNIMCGVGVAVGSGFAVEPHLLVTNRHVVDGASTLQLTRWDGVDISVTTASVAFIADLALVRTQETLPVLITLASKDPTKGERVSAIGYPLGGPMAVTTGAVLGRDTDPDEGFTVIVTNVPVQHGNSGGPLLDDAGTVVGVVYALNTRNGNSYAVPVSTLRRVAADNSRVLPVPPC